MAKTNKNLDIDLDYSKIKYDSTDSGKKVDLIDVEENDRSGEGHSVVISQSDQKKAISRKVEKKTKERIGASKRKKQSVLGTVIVCALLSIMLVMVVQGRVEMNETSKQISSLRSQLTKLEKEERTLNAQLESDVDMLEIEKYAQSSGLLSSANVQKYYVGSSSDGSDDVDIYETEDTLFSGTFATVLSAISQSFMKTWNTISGNE